MFRGCDARVAAIYFCVLCSKLNQQELLDDDILMFSQVLCELSEIAYSYDHASENIQINFTFTQFVIFVWASP